MIIHNIVQHIFSSASGIAVLRTLNSRVVGITGREVARISRVSSRTAQSVLAQLEALGLVNRTIGGRDHLFTLNRHNKIVRKLIYSIFEFETGFPDEITSVIKKKLSGTVSSLILFGSVARKEEDSTSDFDICIVYSDKRPEIEKIVSGLRDELFDGYHVPLAPFYITEADFKRRAKRNRPPVDSILKEGIVLCGKPLRELMK